MSSNPFCTKLSPYIVQIRSEEVSSNADAISLSFKAQKLDKKVILILISFCNEMMIKFLLIPGLH